MGEAGASTTTHFDSRRSQAVFQSGRQGPSATSNAAFDLVYAIRTRYGVFYTVCRFWRFLISCKLRGLSNAGKNDSRRLQIKSAPFLPAHPLIPLPAGERAWVRGWGARLAGASFNPSPRRGEGLVRVPPGRLQFTPE